MANEQTVLSTASNYIIIADGQQYPLRVVETQTFGGAQNIIEYEAPGTNGGVVVVTGRSSNTITLTGKLLPMRTRQIEMSGRLVEVSALEDPLLNLNEQKNIFAQLKNSGRPITLVTPVGNDDTGQYIIENFSGTVEAGIRTYLTFVMLLKEYRQANLKRTAVNLISFAPAEEFKKLLQLRTI